MLAWMRLAGRTAARVNVAANLTHLLAHPVHDLARTLVSTAGLAWRLPAGGGPILLPVIIIAALLAAHGVDGRRGPWAAGIILLSLMAVNGMLLLTWDDPAQSIGTPLAGFQERYVTPLLPLAAFVMRDGTHTPSHG